MTLNAVVVGCGFMGASDIVPGGGIQSHAAAWSHHPGARLAGLCDTDADRLAAAAARWRPRHSGTDLDRVLSASAAAVVSVATSDETHAEIVERVLEHRSVRAILVEKPLALEVRDARRLAAAAERRNVLLAVNYSRRYTPTHQRLKAWLDQQPLGTIEVVHGTYVRGLKHNGTHWLDLARWLIGEIESVAGLGSIADEADDATIDVELRFRGGARGRLVGVATADYSLFEMDLIGSRGRLQITESGQRFTAMRPIPSRRFVGFRELMPVPCPSGGLADLAMHAVSDVVESLMTGRAPAGTASDAIAALALAETAINSLRGEATRDVVLDR